MASGVTTFETTLEMTDVSMFDEEAYKRSVLNSAGGAALGNTVDVDAIMFYVQVQYGIDRAVPEEQIRGVIATAAGVLVSQVAVNYSSSRRLQGRRLATTVDTVINTTEKSHVSEIATRMSNATRVQTAMQDQGVTASVMSASRPRQQVSITTRVTSRGADPPVAPEASSLEFELKQAFGQDVTATLDNVQQQQLHESNNVLHSAGIAIIWWIMAVDFACDA